LAGSADILVHASKWKLGHEGALVPSVARASKLFHSSKLRKEKKMGTISTGSITTSTTSTAPQSEVSKIVGLLYTLGISAAGIFVKNSNHVQTANAIVSVLTNLLPEIEALL